MGKKRKKIIPEGKELLAELAGRLDIYDLRLIAACDYGRDVEKHLEPLLKVKNTLDTTGLDTWHSLEVIELCRWYPPPMVAETKRHEMRAFCCAVLLHSYCDDGVEVTVDSTLGNLLQSLLCIDTHLVPKGCNLYQVLMKSALLDGEDIVLVPICQLIETVCFGDEASIRLQLDAVLAFEKKHSNDDFFIFDKKNDFYAKRERPQMYESWQFVSNYIYETLPKIKDAKLKDDLLGLCIRLWNPDPENYVAVPLKP